MADVMTTVRKMLEPVKRRAFGMVKRAVIESFDDSAGVQTARVALLDDELADGCELVQPVGISFGAHVGGEAVAFTPGGDPSHIVVFAASARGSRPTDTPEGEGGLHFMGQFKVYLDGNGNVHLGMGSGTTAANKLARADRVEAELGKVQATLESLSAGDQEFSKAYTAGDVGADNVYGK